MKTNKKYKDGMFRTIFNEPDKAFQLYCAITGKTHDGSVSVEMKTLDNVLLSNQRNDLAFTVNESLVVIIEHQSTLNRNMPLRMLQYILLYYDLYLNLGQALYKEKQIKLPKPCFYVLYNGQTPYPPSGVMRLSDAFDNMGGDDSPDLELVVKIININYGTNTDVLQRSDELMGYSVFVEKVRIWLSKGFILTEAIKNAADECLAEGYLTNFLNKYKNEVEAMFSLIYDEKIAKQVAREEGREDGLEEGREEGLNEGIELSFEILRAIQNNLSVSEIALKYNIPEEKIEKIAESLSACLK